MASAKEKHKSYLRVAQIYNAFQDQYPVERILRRILRKGGDINFKIPENNSLKSSQAHLAGCTALHIATHKRHINAFNILLNQGSDFTIQNQHGQTVLHCAINHESEDVYQEIINTVLATHIVTGDPTNPCDDNGLSHFHIACLKNNVRAVEFFLDMGIPVDEAVNLDSAQFAGYTPLHFAVKGYAMETVYLLLKYNADRQLKDAKGMSALHALLKHKLTLFNSFNYSDRIKREKELQAIDDIVDLLTSNHTVDSIGLSRFHITCMMQESAAAEYVLHRTRDLNHQVNMNSPVFPGYTALHFAVQCNINTAKLLINKGVNFDVKDAEGKTPIDICLENRRWKELQLILKCRDEWRNTVFGNGKAKLMDFLSVIQDPVIPSVFYNYLRDIVRDVNTYIPHSSSLWPGFTPLHFAVLAYEETSAIIPLCLVQGADATVRDKRGWTPLHLAFRYNKLQATKWLLIHHYELANPTDEDGLSHLHIACACGHEDFVDRLQYSFDLNIVYRGNTSVGLITPGSTLLHVAIASGSSKIVEMLLNHNANIEAKDANGQTPIHRFFHLSDNVREVGRVLLDSRKLKDYMFEKIELSRIHLAVYCENLDEIDRSDANVDVTVNCDDSSSLWFRYNGYTPLYLAIKESASLIFLEKLLRRGADILATCPNGMTPLFEALANNCDKYAVDSFVAKLKSSSEIQSRLKSISGITMLHVACHTVDVEMVTSILANQQVDVNSQIRSDCPIWQGNTPLHLLMKNIKHIDRYGILDNFEAVLKMLLCHGADVVVTNQEGTTPVHLVFEYFLLNQGKDQYKLRPEDYKWMDLLINQQKDFCVNPTNIDGMSHFHAACMVNNVEAVKQFLDHKVDVNHPIDLFAKKFAGETPLHLAVNYQSEKIFGAERQLQTVRLLLTHGANVCVEDAYGFTPLHKAIRKSSYMGVIDKLVSYGATITAESIFGETPLEMILKLDEIPVDVMKFFANLGCRLNASNLITEEGYLSIVVSKYYHCTNQVQAYEVMLDADDMVLVDVAGRIAIHNIVTTADPASGIADYANLMETFFESDYDVDLQDKRGKTALHLASQFGNVMAVEALLNLGADVNVLDRNSRTALFYALKFHRQCKRCPAKQCHKRTIECLARHIRKLQIFQLDIVHLNTYLMQVEVSKIPDFRLMMDIRFSVQLEKTKKMIIEQESKLILYDFLLETKVLLAYPFMTNERRNAIDEFFQSIDNNVDLESMKDICKLQYRKAVKRIRLIDLAADLMQKLAGSPVPVLCQKIIFENLKNSDIENFIVATMNNH